MGEKNIAKFKANKPGGGNIPRVRRRVSLGFVALLVIMLATGYILYSGIIASAMAPFFFVLSGWLVSLCLHEYGHAFAAYHGGDRQVAQTGYLTLDPLAYTHPVYSLVMPALFVIMGFVALPGGAVYIQTSRLNGRHWKCAVSAAGPFATLLCLCLLSVPFALDWPSQGGGMEFWASLALLAGFLGISLVWNLLPLPGLDGWGILASYLPKNIQIMGGRWRNLGPGMLLMAIVLLPGFARFFWNIAFALLSWFDLPSGYLALGMQIFRFWN